MASLLDYIKEPIPEVEARKGLGGQVVQYLWFRYEGLGFRVAMVEF